MTPSTPEKSLQIEFPNVEEAVETILPIITAPDEFLQLIEDNEPPETIDYQGSTQSKGIAIHMGTPDQAKLIIGKRKGNGGLGQLIKGVYRLRETPVNATVDYPKVGIKDRVRTSLPQDTPNGNWLVVERTIPPDNRQAYQGFIFWVPNDEYQV